MINTWKRKALAVVAVALLGIPAALGVYRALLPTRGEWGAGLAAAGFELVYISTALLVLTPELRAYARRVALAAVATSVLLNSIADYSARTAVLNGAGAVLRHGLTDMDTARALFDPLALALSVVESAPLAGLAYAMAELLHRLAETESGHAAAPRPPRRGWRAWLQERMPQPAPLPAAVRIADNTDGFASNSGNAEPARDYACKHCGVTGLTKSEQLAHGRQHARERSQVVAAD